MRIIGVMSGTSLDGIDIALCAIDAFTCKMLYAKEYLFDETLKKRIIEAIEHPVALAEISAVDTDLASMYARAINLFLDEYGIDANTVAAIGLHGQTLWHDTACKNSLQFGNAHLVAASCGIDVVADFRRADIARGGEGAPLTPAFHKFIFNNIDSKAAVLNIGGIANITLLQEPLSGYDVCVGNLLLDHWIAKHRGERYDKEGAWARSGRVDKTLLARLRGDSYLQKEPPKSSGREYFNAQWLERKLANLHVKAVDVQSTLVEFVAVSVADAAKRHGVTELILCGGGAKNDYLCERLTEHLGFAPKRSEDYGVSGDFMEAAAFAYFAYKRIAGEKIRIAGVTGAQNDTYLGVVYAAD